MKNEKLETEGVTLVEQKRIEDCEWVFQFDEDEPQVFAWTDKDTDTEDEPTVTFTISNIEGAYISFKHTNSNKVFKLFARPITSEGKKMRKEANKLKIEAQIDLENFEEKMNEYASENKETEA
jgi:hypothetical protein